MLFKNGLVIVQLFKWSELITKEAVGLTYPLPEKLLLNPPLLGPD
jgi:hypothetical protein